MFKPDCKDTDHRATPEWLLKAIWDKFNNGKPMFDPCPLHPLEDGLKINWGPSAYANPPYSNGLQEVWSEKCIEQYEFGCKVILLLKFDTSTELYHDLLQPKCRVIYTPDCRIKFTDAGSPNFDNAVYVFHKPLDEFISAPTTIIKPFRVKHLRPPIKRKS